LLLDAVAQIFGDITVEHDMSMFNEDHIDIKMDWEELRDDTNFHEFLDSHEFQFETETTVESNEDGNDSFLENLAVMNEH
jgi:hypothetical protein